MILLYELTFLPTGILSLTLWVIDSQFSFFLFFSFLFFAVNFFFFTFFQRLLCYRLLTS